MVLAIAGVNFGWQSAGDGSTGYEYIVQVEPELVDAMQRGDSIPIESNIPAEVAPIRKVQSRGRPRRSAADAAAAHGEFCRARRLGSGQLSGTAPLRSSNDRYYTAQGQSVLDRTQTAVSETGTAISDGVQSGMQSAQEQFSRSGSQMMSNTQNAAQQFGQQLQSTANGMRSSTEQTFDATSNQIRQAGNSMGLPSRTTTAELDRVGPAMAIGATT